MAETVFVHMKEPRVRVLGPGVRYALWVQGCHGNCPGCVAPNTWDMSQGAPIDADALAWEIILSGAEGLTISGGEPFLQARALGRMLDVVHAHRDLGVIVYTGLLYEDLARSPGAEPLLRHIDLLIDGPYVRELDDGKSLRGSSNQRVIPLTVRYEAHLKDYGAPGRPTERFHHGAELNLVGVFDYNRILPADTAPQAGSGDSRSARPPKPTLPNE